MTSETVKPDNGRFGSWLADLATVTLEDLDHAASLQTRVDRKYLITRTDLDDLMSNPASDVIVGNTGASDARNAMQALEIDGRRQFGYWSTYFDTAQLDSFFDAARQRPHRFKVRVRTYLDGGSTYLEVKTRSRRGETVKSRRPTDLAAHDQLSPSDRRFIVDTLDHRLDRHPQSATARLDLEAVTVGLRPTMTTEYHRTTLLVADTSRATIDHALTMAVRDGVSRQLVDQVVVETKSSHRPSPIDRLLWERGLRPVKFSKYGTGLVLLRPELPGSKWNRVLRQQLDWLPADPQPR